MWTTKTAAVAALDRVGAGRWAGEVAELGERIGRHAPRQETRQRLGVMTLALLGDVGRKNCWTLAEHAGEARPWGMQHLLERASWDTDAVGGELRSYVGDRLGEPGGILVVDETGDAKKGSSTVGVQRQYSGTLGRIENCQVAVYLGYASSRGHAMIDRELYLPRSWTEDRARCARAGVPEDVTFATKPALAAVMIDRALDAGVPASWVAGDEVYGANPALARHLEARGLGYVLAIARNCRLPVDAVHEVSAAGLAASLPRSAWETRSAGTGAHGQRWYQWAWVGLDSRVAGGGSTAADPGGRSWSLLIRRHPRTGEQAYYLASALGPTTLSQLVRVAGRRWAIEESFQASKGLAGLDEHQVRGWRPWRRWTLLAMLAHALLAVITALERQGAPPPRGLIALTCAEVRRLLATALATTTDVAHAIGWSRWRRGHQHTARTCHYAARGDRPPA